MSIARSSGLVRCALVALLVPAAANAGILRVPSQHATIQTALNLAVEGDTVLVAPGTYTDTVTGSFDYDETTFCARLVPGVILRSEQGADVTRIHLPASEALVSYALIGAGTGYGFESDWTTIEGFTVSADSGTTGGCALFETRTRIQDCVFSDIVSTTPDTGRLRCGGAIRAFNVDFEIDRTRFIRCRAPRGGAMKVDYFESTGEINIRDSSFEECTGTAIRFATDGYTSASFYRAMNFERCMLRDNVGGAVFMVEGGHWWDSAGDANLVFRSTRLEGNSGGPTIEAGALRAVWLEECVLVDNDAGNGAVIEVEGTVPEYDDSARSVRFCDFRRNSGARGCMDWRVSGGEFHNNLFLDNQGTISSVGYFAPHPSMHSQIRANVFTGNGPAPLVVYDSPIGIQASCNLVWENDGAAPLLPGFDPVDPQFCNAGAESLTVSQSSPCLSENNTSLCLPIGNFTAGCPDRGITTIGIASIPPAREVVVNGENRWTPTLYSGLPEDVVPLSTSTVQLGIPGERFVWTSWSDGGASAHNITIGEAAEEFTASFDHEFLLKTEAGPGGTTTPLEAWLLEGSEATITAIPNEHSQFYYWAGSGSGSYSGTANPATVQMNGPITEHADFEVASYPVSMVAGPGGAVFPASGTFLAESLVAIRAEPDAVHTFVGWIGSGPISYTGADSSAWIQVNGPIQQTAYFAPMSIGFNFTVSASDTDPFATVAPPSNGWRSLYLWATCIDRGLSAFEAEVSTALTITDFQPQNGVLNAGSGNHLLLAIPNCPVGPSANALLGHWFAFDSGGQICLVPSSESGTLGAVDCDVPNPHLWVLPVVEGFSSLGEPCVTGEWGCQREETDPNILDPGGVDAPPSGESITSTHLAAPRPNPFSKETRLHFDLANAGPVTLAVYDVRGRLVRRLLDEQRSMGRHSLAWDGRDGAGGRVAPGIFFVRLEAGSFVGVRRIVLLPHAK